MANNLQDSLKEIDSVYNKIEKQWVNGWAKLSKEELGDLKKLHKKFEKDKKKLLKLIDKDGKPKSGEINAMAIVLDTYRDIQIAYEVDLIEKFFDNASKRHYTAVDNIKKAYAKYRFLKYIMPR